MNQSLRRIVKNRLQCRLRHTGTVPWADIKICAEGPQLLAHFAVDVKPHGGKRRHDGRTNRQRGEHDADALQTQTQRPPDQ